MSWDPKWAVPPKLSKKYKILDLFSIQLTLDLAKTSLVSLRKNSWWLFQSSTVYLLYTFCEKSQNLFYNNMIF